MNKFVRKFTLIGYGLSYPIYVIGEKIIISKSLYEKRKLSIEGLGLNKFEREIYNIGFLKFNGVLTIRYRNLIITYNNKGYLEQCKNMKIIQ